MILIADVKEVVPVADQSKTRFINFKIFPLQENGMISELKSSGCI